MNEELVSPRDSGVGCVVVMDGGVGCFVFQLYTPLSTSAWIHVLGLLDMLLESHVH